MALKTKEVWCVQSNTSVPKEMNHFGKTVITSELIVEASSEKKALDYIEERNKNSVKPKTYYITRKLCVVAE